MKLLPGWPGIFISRVCVAKFASLLLSCSGPYDDITVTNTAYDYVFGYRYTTHERLAMEQGRLAYLGPDSQQVLLSFDPRTGLGQPHALAYVQQPESGGGIQRSLFVQDQIVNQYPFSMAALRQDGMGEAKTLPRFDYEWTPAVLGDKLVYATADSGKYSPQYKNELIIRSLRPDSTFALLSSYPLKYPVEVAADGEHIFIQDRRELVVFTVDGYKVNREEHRYPIEAWKLYSAGNVLFVTTRNMRTTIGALVQYRIQPDHSLVELSSVPVVFPQFYFR